MYLNIVKKLSFICLLVMSIGAAFAETYLDQGETYTEQDWAPQIIWQVYPDTGEAVTLLKESENETRATYQPAPGTGRPESSICAKYPDKCVINKLSLNNE